ncbi:MAG TPA: sodium:solute symporter family protein [Spirochaetota bacterium]|nr:sodium:solute symporter family protein [Spirochaetota bacterium]
MSNGILIIIFFAGMLCIGYFSSKKITGIEGFYTGNRSGGVMVIAGSLLATIVGGSGTLGLAGLGFSQGLTGAWWLLAGVPGLVFLGVFFARKIHSCGVYTLPGVLERQYGSRAVKITASLLISVSWLGIIAGQIIAAGKVLSAVWPGSTMQIIVAVGTVITLYTALGGQYSILRTDAVQMLIITVGIIICGIAAYHTVGGIQGLSASLPEGHLSFPLSPDFGEGMLVYYLFFVGATFFAGPDMYSRVFCADSPETAKKSLLLAAAGIIPVAAVIVFTGMSARVLFPGIGAEDALPTLVAELLPAGISGLVLAALLAALMSSADTCLMTASMILAGDVIGSAGKNPLPENRQLFLTRMMILLLGGCSVAIALYYRNIISALLLAYTVYAAAVLVPLTAGFFAEKLRLHPAGALVSVIVSGSLGLFLTLTGHRGPVLVVCFPVSGFVLFTVSFVFRRWISTPASNKNG